MNNRYPFWKKAGLLLYHLIPGKGKYGQIFFTKRCNFNCDYCQVTKRETKDTSIQHWKKMAKKMSYLGVTYVSITGGEPSVREDLEELISCFSQLRIFSSLNSNGKLLTTERIDSLADAGLCSLVISLDSLDQAGDIKGNCEKVFNLLAYAKEKGIIPQTKTVVNPHDLKKVIPLAEEVTKRGFLFGMELLQAVGGLFSRPSRFSHIEKGMAQTKDGLWLPADYFQEVPGIGYRWKCNSEIDPWITINNDGSLMTCQEWGSEIPFLSIDSLNDSYWRENKRATIAQCPGCYYECYFSKEMVYKSFITTFKQEFKTLFRAWRMLH